MKDSLKKLQKLEDAIVVIAFAVMSACVFFQVLNRNFIKLALPWLDELATYCMIYMTLLGTEAGLRDGSQISVTGLVDKLHGSTRQTIRIIAKGILVFFSCVMLIYSVNMVRVQALAGQTTAAMHLPMAVPYLALVLSFGIIVLVQSATFLKMILTLKNGQYNDEDQKEAQ